VDVPLQFPEEFAENADKVLEMKAFKDWCGSLDPEFIVKSILVQSVDMFGPRVGFLKFKAQVSDKEDSVVPSIVFMRGASVAVLFIIRCDEDGKLFTILTVQARFPTGKLLFHDIPAGMMDQNGDFNGVAAKEMKEETGIEVRCWHSIIYIVVSITAIYIGVNSLFPRSLGEPSTHSILRIDGWSQPHLSEGQSSAAAAMNRHPIHQLVFYAGQRQGPHRPHRARERQVRHRRAQGAAGRVPVLRRLRRVHALLRIPQDHAQGTARPARSRVRRTALRMAAPAPALVPAALSRAGGGDSSLPSAVCNLRGALLQSLTCAAPPRT
jgi:8-oxo-dGTP pyrophosphatase MutT (NUDIX family)